MRALRTVVWALLLAGGFLLALLLSTGLAGSFIYANF